MATFSLSPSTGADFAWKHKFEKKKSLFKLQKIQILCVYLLAVLKFYFKWQKTKLLVFLYENNEVVCDRQAVPPQMALNRSENKEGKCQGQSVQQSTSIRAQPWIFTCNILAESTTVAPGVKPTQMPLAGEIQAF